MSIKLAGSVGLNKGGGGTQDASAESIDVLTPTDSNVIVGDGTRWVAESGATARTSLGVGTGDSPQFTGVNIGHATDTTLTRTGAGDVAIEGNGIYRASGTDVAVADGGTGSSTAAAAQVALGVAAVVAQNSQSVAYELVLADAGKNILHPAADANDRTFTIPANAAVAFVVGTIIRVTNQVNTLSIAITADTLTLVPAGTTGTITLAANESALLEKVEATAWTAVKFSAASATLQGVVELATSAETLTGTDAVRAVTPQGAAATYAAKFGTATFVIGAEAADVINVGIQLVDAAAVDLAVRGSVYAYLSDDANGDSIVATAPSGGWAIGTDGLLMDVVANKSAMLVSEADGDIDINITHAGAKTAYLILVNPDGRLIASAAITFGA